MNRSLHAASFLLVAGWACAPASAQPMSVRYTLRWTDIGGAFSNGIVEPGESVAFVVDASFTPAVGATVTYSPPPPPGTGTVAGLGLAWFDVVNSCGDGAGIWTLSGPGFNGTTGTNWGLRTGWNLAGAGTPQPDGSVRDIQAGQFPIPGQTANPLNPIVEIWRGRWTPASLAARVIRFTAQGSAAGAPNNAALLVQYGAGPGGQPLYTSKFVGTTVSEVNIPFGMGGPTPFCPCYANCDFSTILPVLNVMDYTCFLNMFGAGQSYANCDQSTVPPILNVNDFVCFQNSFVAGCP